MTTDSDAFESLFGQVSRNPSRAQSEPQRVAVPLARPVATVRAVPAVKVVAEPVAAKRLPSRPPVPGQPEPTRAPEPEPQEWVEEIAEQDAVEEARPGRPPLPTVRHRKGEPVKKSRKGAAPNLTPTGRERRITPTTRKMVLTEVAALGGIITREVARASIAAADSVDPQPQPERDANGEIVSWFTPEPTVIRPNEITDGIVDNQLRALVDSRYMNRHAMPFGQGWMWTMTTWGQSATAYPGCKPYFARQAGMRGDRVRHIIMISAVLASIKGYRFSPSAVDGSATLFTDRVIEAAGAAHFAKREDRTAWDWNTDPRWDSERSVAEQVLEEPWWLAIPSFHEGVRIPDITAINPDGTVHAVEIELSPKSVERYTALLRDYQRSALSTVTYVYATDAIRNRITAAAKSLGIDEEFLRFKRAPMEYINPTNRKA